MLGSGKVDMMAVAKLVQERMAAKAGNDGARHRMTAEWSTDRSQQIARPRHR